MVLDGGVPKGRVLVIGLDGATWDNILPLIEQGKLPVFADLLKRGSWGALNSTVPCVTPPAWGSFLTGACPARHGVLDFTDRLDIENAKFVTFKDLTVPPIWSVMTHFDRRAVFLNLPFTYPPASLNGIMVPGPPLPEDRFATFPADFKGEIVKHIPAYSPVLKYENLDEFLKEIYRATEYRRQLAKWLLDEDYWDFFMVTFTATDRLHHKMWHSNEIISEYYPVLDKALGDIIGGLDSDTYVFLMSDHGFTGIRSSFYLNKWLARNGFLKAEFGRPRDGDPRYLNPAARRRNNRGKARGFLRLLRFLPGGKDLMWKIDLARTKAFAGFGHLPGVFVNLEGRYGNGIVSREDYEGVRDELIELLSSVHTPSGERLFKRVARREELFEGPHVERMPDVVTEMNYHEVKFTYSLDVGPIFRKRKRIKGWHAPNGMFLVTGPGIRPGHKVDGTNIQDLAPLILFLMGLPQLSSMDGVLPQEVLEPKFFDNRQVAVLPVEEIDYSPEDHEMSEQEHEEIRRNLEALGYM